MCARNAMQFPLTGRLLAIDYGKKRVGLAVSDALQMTANALETKIIDGGRTRLFEELERLCVQQKIVGIVVGKPLHMDGSEGEMVELVRKFADELHAKTGIPIRLWDERLTSLQARNALHSYGKKPSRHKSVVDKLAAAFLLQSFLDRQNR